MHPKAFITNDKIKTLKKRLEQLIKHSKELKFLVGFFYFSGWRELYSAIKDNPHLTMKILVGLDVDKMLGETIEYSHSLDNSSSDEKAERYFQSLEHALNNEEMDIEDFYTQVDFFLNMLENDKIIIRKTDEPNHAKLYLFSISDGFKELISHEFITGSSNLTRAGILEQNEFNVEIRDYGYEEAERYFDALWNTALPITEYPERKGHMIDLIRNRTQAAAVTPYEAYVLVLKTYVELMEQKEIKPLVRRLLEERGYKNYGYQLDAVNQALTIIENYNGVIIADVVGLGKSIIAGLVAKSLGKRGLIICPPGIMGNDYDTSGWRKYRRDFKLDDWRIGSSGNLQKEVDYLKEQGDDIEIVIIDEAHRFRNQDTQDHELLGFICKNRIVILLTATPFNNTPADIHSLIKLFIVPGQSKVTLDNNLEGRFKHYNTMFHKLSYISKNHSAKDAKSRNKAERYYKDIFGNLPIKLQLVNDELHKLSVDIRNVLEPILIRRNRLDLRNDPVYSREVTELSETQDPIQIFYELSKEQSEFYDTIINLYFADDGRFKGAIYQPYIYEIGATDSDIQDEEWEFQQQKNLYNFMRRILVKRFESSFGAFWKSIQNFERVHERVLQFIKNSKGKYILDRKLLESTYDSEYEDIEEELIRYSESLDQKKRPKNEKIYDIAKFKYQQEFLNDINSDLELFKEIGQSIQKLGLIDRDPKAESLIQKVKAILDKQSGNEPVRKVIIFSEYVDTVKHLDPLLKESFGGSVLTLADNLTKSIDNEILSNFDASQKISKQEDVYKILLTSDKLSEGVNLNRAGAVVNYDIPWNPTRVIQRVGRINRIGKKVFDKLFIYNFFPTEVGADVIKSRQIAGQKMFLIHSILGEDSKIFDIDETPSPAELFKRINTNPEESEEESVLTKVRRLYMGIKQRDPEVISKISQFPARVKTAKAYKSNQLNVFRKKSLAFFIHSCETSDDQKVVPESLSIMDALEFIKCDKEEKRLPLSSGFWNCYEKVKTFSESFKVPHTENSLEVKSHNNLNSALKHFRTELEEYIPFIRTLISDLRDYKTLSKFTLRRLSSVELTPGSSNLNNFVEELKYIRTYLGDDYLKEIKQKLGNTKSEVIVAVENIDKMS